MVIIWEIYISDQLLLILYKITRDAIKKELNVHVLAIEIDSYE